MTFLGRDFIKLLLSYALVAVTTCDLNIEFQSEIIEGLSSNLGPYKAFPCETLVKVPAGSLRRAQSNFSQVTFYLQFGPGIQIKMSQVDVNLNFASLPCCNSNSWLEENLTKSNCRKFQQRAQRKASEIKLYQKFQLDLYENCFFI